VHTAVTHLACLGVVVGVGIGRHYVPLFGIIRYFIPAMAPFECTWLFSAATTRRPVQAVKKIASSAPTGEVEQPVEPTAEDYEAWLKHLATRHPSTVKRGLSVKDEYEQFIAARAQKRASDAASVSNPST
jgi:hypothetical protein